MKKTLLILLMFIISFSLKSQKPIVKNINDIIVLRTVWTNPAFILQGKEKIKLVLNYTNGPAAFAKAKYPFAGISYRVTNKFTAGIGIGEWVGRKKLPKNIAATTLSINRSRKTNYSLSLVAAYNITRQLKAGIAGKFLKEKNRASICALDMGISYSKPSSLFRNNNIRNQQLHFVANLQNIKMGSKPVQHINKATPIKYHDMPSVLKVEAGYSFSLIVETDPSNLKNQINSAAKTIDLHPKLSYQHWYKKGYHIYNNYKYQSFIAVGMDATVLDFFSLRMGYYHEMMPASDNKQTVKNQHAKSIYWGIGLKLPVKNLFHTSCPAIIKFEALTKNNPGLIDKIIAQRTPRDFRDSKLLFSLSIEISLK